MLLHTRLISPATSLPWTLSRAGACHYVDAGTTREFNHTVIKDAFRGQGLSAPLIKAALDDARGVGKQVIASCSAVAHFIEKNPEYRDLLRSEGM